MANQAASTASASFLMGGRLCCSAGVGFTERDDGSCLFPHDMTCGIGQQASRFLIIAPARARPDEPRPGEMTGGHGAWHTALDAHLAE